MEKWEEKIKQNDITKACQMTGLKSTRAYYTNYKLPKEKWSDTYIKIMTNLKSIVEEREALLQNL